MTNPAAIKPGDAEAACLRSALSHLESREPERAARDLRAAAAFASLRPQASALRADLATASAWLAEDLRREPEENPHRSRASRRVYLRPRFDSPALLSLLRRALRHLATA